MTALATPLHRALDRMRQASKRVRGVPVTFVDLSEGSSTSVVAVLATNRTEVEDENSVHRGEKLHDFLVDAADLAYEPERGDYFMWQDRRYLVTHPAGERVFEYHDSGRNSYRIHTIEVPYGTAPIEPPPIEPPPIDPPPIDPPPVDVFGYAPSGNAGVDTYGSPSGDIYAPP